LLLIVVGTTHLGAYYELCLPNWQSRWTLTTLKEGGFLQRNKFFPDYHSNSGSKLILCSDLAGRRPVEQEPEFEW